MKLNKTPRVDVDAGTARWYREVANQVNGLSEGLISASYNALTTAPTGGTWSKGDFVVNSNPSELGGVGNKYVIRGFLCLVSGTPGTWVECRFLTGA